jgi:DNA-binding IclR family transcriptional regulator
MTGEDATVRLDSVARTMAVLEAIVEREGAGVSELATALELPKSTVHGYLATLSELGYLVREGDSYELGTRFLSLGEYSRTRRPAYRMVQSTVSALADRTDERSQFVVPERGEGVFLYRATGDRAVETGSGVGQRMWLHSTAAGKAILAALPADRVEAVLARHGLPAVTDATITDRTALDGELAAVREQGYALNRGETIEGLHAVGVTVRGGGGQPIGALSISGPSHRLTGDYLTRELPELLLGTANELELNIAYR